MVIKEARSIQDDVLQETKDESVNIDFALRNVCLLGNDFTISSEPNGCFELSKVTKGDCDLPALDLLAQVRIRLGANVGCVFLREEIRTGKLVTWWKVILVATTEIVVELHGLSGPEVLNVRALSFQSAHIRESALVQ